MTNLQLIKSSIWCACRLSVFVPHERGVRLFTDFFLQIRTSGCMLSHSALYLGFTASEHRAWKSPISTEFRFSISRNNITTYITGVSRLVFQSVTHNHANIWSYKHV